MNEFQLIETYFQGLLPDSPRTTLGIGDDAAIVRPEAKHELVVAVDTLVENRHFLASDMPSTIAHKALAVNLSDLAAMGAQPIGFLLALTLPKLEPHWLENFSSGLKALAQAYDLPLLGGDTTKGPLTISITVLGQVPEGQALKRKGAQSGESIFVSGELGAAAMVVKQHRHEITVPEPELEEAYPLYNKPKPQIDLGLSLRGIATSCIDISDGLAQDCMHILQSSSCGARINIETLPIHPSVLRSLPEVAAQQLALTGGDDYQLLFTAPASVEAQIQDIAKNLNVPISKIGQVTPGHELILSLHGDITDWELAGWDHFQ